MLLAINLLECQLKKEKKNTKKKKIKLQSQIQKIFEIIF